MSDLLLILVVAVITYSSRAAAVVLLPGAQGYLLGLVNRIPGPLFAGLAIFALIGDTVAMPDPSAAAATVAALLVTPRRSLGVTLLAGIVGFVAAELIF